MYICTKVFVFQINKVDNDDDNDEYGDNDVNNVNCDS